MKIKQKMKNESIIHDIKTPCDFAKSWGGSTSITSKFIIRLDSNLEHMFSMKSTYLTLP